MSDNKISTIGKFELCRFKLNNEFHRLTKEWFLDYNCFSLGDTFTDTSIYSYSVENRIMSYVIFRVVSFEMQLRLIITDPEFRGMGYGTMIMKKLIQYAYECSCRSMHIIIPPPEYNHLYLATINFLIKHGFILVNRYDEMWCNGAIELRKELL